MEHLFVSSKCNLASSPVGFFQYYLVVCPDSWKNVGRKSSPASFHSRESSITFSTMTRALYIWFIINFSFTSLVFFQLYFVQHIIDVFLTVKQITIRATYTGISSSCTDLCSCIYQRDLTCMHLSLKSARHIFIYITYWSNVR